MSDNNSDTIINKDNNSTNENDDGSEQSMVTTIDNPFNPFTQFDEWLAFDESKGYFTLNYLARILKSSDELSIIDQNIAAEEAIDEIVDMNILGIYIKVTEKNFKKRTQYMPKL